MILAIGAFNIEYIHDNCREPLKHIYGDSITTVNALPLILYLGLKKTENIIFQQIENNHVTTVFFYHDWIKGSFSECFFTEIRNLGIKTAAFYPDDEPEYWFNDNLKYDHHYDVIGTHSEQGCLRRLENNDKCDVIHAPWGFNPRIFSSLNIAKKYDLIFVGKHKSLKEDGQARTAFLEEIVKLVELNGWSFAIYGYGWQRHPTLAKYWLGAVTGEELPKVICSAKIVLNPAWSSDSESPKPQVKLRHFEVLGTRNIQLTNFNSELLQTIGPVPHVVYYKELYELDYVISDVLNRDDNKVQIEPYEKLHSMDARLQKIIEHAKKNDLSAVSELSQVKVEKVRYSLFENQEDFTNKVLQLAKRCDYLHFINDGFSDNYCDYTNYNLSNASPDSFIKINFSINFSTHQKNHLHTDDANNVFWEFFDQHRDYNYWQCKYPQFLEKISRIIELNSEKIPIEGVLIPSSKLHSFLDWKNNIFTDCNVETQPDSYGVELTPLNEFVIASKFDDFTLTSLFESKITLLVEKLSKNNISFGIYGARGHVSTTLQKILSQRAIKPHLIIDNGIVGEYVGSIKVQSHFDLLNNAPKVMLICAEVSGPSIISSIEKDAIQCEILTVYNLN
ncbi:hypothetical protein [Psychromonas sp. SA13A]|uniref:glycosyltransferase family protein n=1 Tax=Psychromonas sp. SA13A TaxID=2686346 RepID=UPI001409BB97|nr:hypothetical protein [Psychromonas sp. SA13A]